MGWAERMAAQAVQASREPVVTAPAPVGPALGAAPSEFLEAVARGAIGECLRAQGEIQRVLSPPAIVGPSGQAAARPDPVALILATQMRLLHGQAVMLDLLLTFLSGRPELRPVQAPGNGDAPKVD